MKNLAFLVLCAVVALTSATALYPNGCPKNWLIRKLIPHPTNCNQFYECWIGRRILRSCPRRFYFNEDRNRCERQLVSDCNRNNTIENDEPKPDENDGDLDEGNYDPSKAPSICAVVNSDGVLVAHEKCRKYYICVHGKPVARRCPADLFFNPKNDECDWPENVNCRHRDISSSEEEDQNDHVGGGNSNPDKAPSICAAKNSSGVLVAHRICNQYYICDHGKPVARRCPANLFFNPKNDECDWPENVHCRHRDIFRSDEKVQNDHVGGGNSYPDKAPSICAAKNSSGVLVAHRRCNKYYICDHGKPVARRCPANLFFNPKNDECDWPENVHCRHRDILRSDEKVQNDHVGGGNSNPDKAPSICAAKNSSGVLVAHRRCNQYYICDHGKPVARRCPANLFFNPKNDECDWPENVHCRHRDILRSDEKVQNDHVGGGNSNPDKAPSICAAKNSSGVLVAHRRCNQYYICDHGIPVAQRCPANLFFNPKKDECDWPTNVKCRGR